jgi:hypothetical protein
MRSYAHCKESVLKIRNKYSQKRNCAATFLITTFMCLWAISIFPWSICLLCCRKYVAWSWEYVNRSQTHECGNWDWCRAIPRKGIHKCDFRCSTAMLIYWHWTPCNNLVTLTLYLLIIKNTKRGFDCVLYSILTTFFLPLPQRIKYVIWTKRCVGIILCLGNNKYPMELRVVPQGVS